MAVVACQALIALVFLVAVAGKVTDYRAFVDSVRDLGFRPAAPIAPVVLAGEIAVTGLAVVLPRAGFALAAVMLVAFAAAIARALRRGAVRPCRCFGRSATPLARAHVWRNVLLAAVASAGAVAPAGTPGLGFTLEAAVAGLVAGALVVRLDDLRHLFRAA